MTISVMLLSSALGSRAVIAVLHDEREDTQKEDPSCGVVPTNSGRLEHGWVDVGVNT